MDSDNVSTASFEDIGAAQSTANNVVVFKTTEEKNVDKLKELIEKSAANVGTELSEDDVPDVCYLLQYRGLGGRLIDVRRSSEPIDVNFADVNEETDVVQKKKPVIEIVTKVSTAVFNKRFLGGRAPRRQLHPHARFAKDPYAYDDYNEYDPYGRDRREVYDDDGEMKIRKVEQTAMVIYSQHLINALKAVVGYYPGTNFMGKTVRINAPYAVLVHHRAALARYKVSQPEGHDDEYASTTAKHIDVLLGFLEKALGNEIRNEEVRHKSSTPTATFSNLWMVLKPGEVIYARHDNRWASFVISNVNWSLPTPEDPDVLSYQVNCWNIQYSGDRLRRAMFRFHIDHFSGEEAIENLSVIPARFFCGDEENAKAAEEKQIRLGKLTWELAKSPAYMAYDGGLVERDMDFNWNHPTSATGYMSGRVIIDCEGFGRFSNNCPGYSRGRVPRQPPPPAGAAPAKDTLPYFAPRCGCKNCSSQEHCDDYSPFADFEDLDPCNDDPPENDLYFLVLTKVVPGFILGDRRWGHFNVEYVNEIKADKEAFKYLVLDDEIKLTVKALIGKFASANGQVSPWPNDFVKNKGQGRIFLLHGSPGVGKTCTAECVAELTHRPLLSLTSGDLSTNSLTVEKNLEYFLQLGERYGAMVLLDEADVYLEARRSKDIARNGLVSIFLRALEYYRGVLFLTTNRVQTFDSAFTSRIHVALHYKSLTDGDREKIWMNSFDRLERDAEGKVHISVATREYAYQSQDVQSLRWNGREIRNALQTAVALAETEALDDGNEKVSVTDKHLRAVVKMSRGFKDFLHKHRLRDDSDLEYDDDDEEDLDDEEGSILYD